MTPFIRLRDKTNERGHFFERVYRKFGGFLFGK